MFFKLTTQPQPENKKPSPRTSYIREERRGEENFISKTITQTTFLSSWCHKNIILFSFGIQFQNQPKLLITFTSPFYVLYKSTRQTRANPLICTTHTIFHISGIGRAIVCVVISLIHKTRAVHNNISYSFIHLYPDTPYSHCIVYLSFVYSILSFFPGVHSSASITFNISWHLTVIYIPNYQINTSEAVTDDCGDAIVHIRTGSNWSIEL